MPLDISTTGRRRPVKLKDGRTYLPSLGLVTTENLDDMNVAIAAVLPDGRVALRSGSEPFSNGKKFIVVSPDGHKGFAKATPEQASEGRKTSMMMSLNKAISVMSMGMIPEQKEGQKFWDYMKENAPQMAEVAAMSAIPEGKLGGDALLNLLPKEVVAKLPNLLPALVRAIPRLAAVTGGGAAIRTGIDAASGKKLDPAAIFGEAVTPPLIESGLRGGIALGGEAARTMTGVPSSKTIASEVARPENQAFVASMDRISPDQPIYTRPELTGIEGKRAAQYAGTPAGAAEIRKTQREVQKPAVDAYVKKTLGMPDVATDTGESLPGRIEAGRQIQEPVKAFAKEIAELQKEKAEVDAANAKARKANDVSTKQYVDSLTNPAKYKGKVKPRRPVISEEAEFDPDKEERLDAMTKLRDQVPNLMKITSKTAPEDVANLIRPTNESEARELPAFLEQAGEFLDPEQLNKMHEGAVLAHMQYVLGTPMGGTEDIATGVIERLGLNAKGVHDIALKGDFGTDNVPQYLKDLYGGGREEMLRALVDIGQTERLGIKKPVEIYTSGGSNTRMIKGAVERTIAKLGLAKQLFSPVGRDYAAKAVRYQFNPPTTWSDKVIRGGELGYLIHKIGGATEAAGPDMNRPWDANPEAVSLNDPSVTEPYDFSRPRLQNKDGTYSTEFTITVESGGKFYVVPTIVNGKRLSQPEAIEAWRSGSNRAVAVYGSSEDAEAGSTARSQRIGRVLESQQ